MISRTLVAVLALTLVGNSVVYEINYSQVVQVNRDGMPTVVKVAIWTVVGAFALAILADILAFYH